MTVSCRVCGIEDWLHCDCYYLHGGDGGLGDMKVEVKMTVCPEECPSFMGGSCACENSEFVQKRLKQEQSLVARLKSEGIYDCPECGWVTECYPNCPIKENA